MGRIACALLATVGIVVSAHEVNAEVLTEEQFVSTVVVPRCEAQWGADNARASIAQEKANPSGVVDLVALHEAGQVLQYWLAAIKKLDVAYAARRHHAFRGWMTEPACIVEYDKSMVDRGCARVEDAAGKSHHWVCP